MTPRSCRRLQLLALLCIAAAFRAVAVERLPVVHDEVYVMAYGLARAFVVGDAAALVFDTPLTVSNGITPLWWWIQAIPASLFGETSKLGLRIVPTALGLASVAVAFAAGARLRSVRAGWFAGLLMAVMPLAVYTNARGEFAESLIVFALLALVADLAGPADTRPGRPSRASATEIPLRAALWPALVLLTYLGKGVVVWAAWSLVVVGLWALGRFGRVDPDRAPTAYAFFLLTLPWVPASLWLWAADARGLSSGQVLTDIGPVHSVQESVRKLTVGYGTEVKEFMVSTWRDALYVYTDVPVWPVLACLAVPVVALLVLHARRLVVAVASRDALGAERALVPLALTLPVLAVLLSKGALGARFHLLYLAVLVPYLGVLLDEWFSAAEQGSRVPVWVGAALTAAFVAWAGSWEDRVAGLHDVGRFAVIACAGLALLAAASGLARRGAGAAGVAIVSLALVTLSATHGPLDWGRRLAWEPGPPGALLPYPLERFENPDLSLMKFYLSRELAASIVAEPLGPGGSEELERVRARVFERARPLVLRAFDTHPADPATLRAAGYNLYHYSPPDRPHVLATWQRYLVRHPDSAEVRELLETVGAAPGPGGLD